jgi:hypothetical protein
MKKIILITTILLAVFSFEKSFGKHCCAFFDVGGTTYIAQFYTLSIFADTLFDNGSTINLPVTASAGNGANCICTSNSTWWTHNGVLIINSNSYTVSDTGDYIIHENVDGGLSCGGIWNFQLTLHVGYRLAATVSVISNPGNFQIYPCISTGIFRIRTDAQCRIKKIAVSDEAGRIIYTTENNFSELNLCGFAQGIYFYASEDETGKVYRGKLIKD